MRLDRLPLMHDDRSMFKVADPQGVTLIARPAAANLLLHKTEPATRGPFPAEVPIERGTGHLSPQFMLQDLIDHLVAATGLFELEFDGPGQQPGL